VSCAACIKQDLLITESQNGYNRYCLRNKGVEYLIYQPQSGSFTVRLEKGNYRFEWFNPTSGKVFGTGLIEADGGEQVFEPPFEGDAVPYLHAEDGSAK